jgi:ABC-2 type transport system permease protein
LRLRRQFRGENLNEAAARPAIRQVQGLQVGWDLPVFSQPVAAVFEKEMRYLARSGPMLLTLIMPLFMLLVFRMGAMNAMHQSGLFTRTPDMAFPSAAAYSLLVLTNLVCNSFGGDGNGMQFFYASPALFRDIVLGKNLAYGAILAVNTVLALIAISVFYGRPDPAITVATLAGLLFAAPLNFTVGNLLSIYSPRKRDFSTFGRQNVSQMTVLISLGVQVVIVAVGAAAFAVARYCRNLWIAVFIFLALSVITLSLYVMVQRRLDGLAIERRETMLAELCRA